jgi:4-amino-4-deoxychorismate lyase
MPDITLNQQLDWQERALHYGDGLFETLLKLDGGIALWQDHYQRLKKGCERLRIPLIDEQRLAQLLAEQTGDMDTAVIKIIVSRGIGGRGLGLPEQNQASVFILKYPYKALNEAQLSLNVSICETRLPINRNLAGLKHLNRLDYVLAAIEIDKQDNQDEGILCDSDGYLVEGVISNLFFVNNDVVCTPGLEHAGVEGVMRQRVIEHLQQQDIPVNIGRFYPELLLQASECFMCNSVQGIRPIQSIDQQLFESGPISQRLIQTFKPEARTGLQRPN